MPARSRVVRDNPLRLIKADVNITAMARIHEIVFDSRHPASIARFWAAALDDYEVAPYDEAELARLRSNGINDPEDDPTVLVEAPGAGPHLFFQLVPEPRIVKNRVHLDLRCDSFEAELERLTALGARVLAEHDSFVTLLDPEGNEFCLSRRTAR
jgi:Glyoxalase-like domain